MILVPRFIADYIRLILKIRKFPGRIIQSHMIADDVTIGNRTLIGEGVILGKGVTIGDYSYVNRGSLVASGTIGRFCSIAYNCQIGVDEHPTEHLTSSPWLCGPGIISEIPGWIDTSNPPVIGHDVWIGSQAIVLRGVNVGTGAIIAAGAVVTKDVAPYSIVGGIPARIIRKRFNEETINRLFHLRWWDMSDDQLRNIKELFMAGGNWQLLLDDN